MVWSWGSRATRRPAMLLGPVTEGGWAVSGGVSKVCGGPHLELLVGESLLSTSRQVQ